MQQHAHPAPPVVATDASVDSPRPKKRSKKNEAGVGSSSRPGPKARACAECKRLKMKCDREFPCKTCIKRGLEGICPEGSLATGQGNTKTLYEKIDGMSKRMRDLEEALRLSNAEHALLQEELLRVKGQYELHGVDSPSASRDSQFPASPLGVTPAPAQTHFASSSLASALDISEAGPSRLQGTPYLNPDTLDGAKAPPQGDAAGLHDNVHQLTNRPRDMHGQQDPYMDHPNNGSDFESLWKDYSNSITDPHDTNHAHSGASTSAAVAAQEPFSSMFLDFEEQVLGGEDAAYMMQWTQVQHQPQYGDSDILENASRVLHPQANVADCLYQTPVGPVSVHMEDAEPDPNNLCHATRAACIGVRPALAELRPHPLQPRGERCHALLNPQPEGIEALIAQDNDEEAEGDDEEDKKAQTLRQKTRLAKHAVKEDEKGDGWGFVEGGSQGPGRGLGSTIPEGKEESEGRRKKRLKLTTDQKSPPKMACHSCRNKKIACGEGSIDEKTCNQCERRGLRCVFPTESRRGMRVRKPKSGHTVDGVHESVKDAMDDYGDFDAPDDISFGATSTPYPAPQQVRKRGGGGRGRGCGRVRPRGPGRVGRPPGRGRARKDELSAVDEPVVSGGDDGSVDVDFTKGDEELASGSADLTYDVPADDPLASLAAETRLHEQLNGSPPSYGLPETHQFAVSIGLNSGPFTRNPLSRRKTISE